jgi:hypothetical protein
MTDAETIAKLRKDVDVLTGLVIGLVTAAEMRTRVAVRNYEAAADSGSTVMSAVTLTELAMQQAQVLRLENQDRSALTGDVETGYQGLLARLNDAIGDYAMPVISETRAAA